MGSSASLDRSPKVNAIEKAGGLPPYVREIARAIEKDGTTLSRAIGIAIGRIKVWARGGGGVSAATTAKAAKALAAWEALKARMRGMKVTESDDGALRDVGRMVLEAAVAADHDERTRAMLDVEITDPKVLAGACRRVLEAASSPAESMSKRKPGESLGSYGSRLKARDAAIEKGREAAKKKGKTTRSGKDAEFERQHPRGRGGSWTLKAGGGQQDADAVRAVQRKVGAEADGKFGGQTAAKVRAFQAKNGLKVDGIVGAQTLAALSGKKGNVAPGVAKGSDFAEFAKRGKVAKGGRKSMRVAEALGALGDVDLDEVTA